MKSPERPQDEIFGQATIDEALEGLGTCNVLIAGRTGVGKSTLINSVFHGDMATTGHGTPVTRTARLIRKEGVPLGIWDTRGLEMADFRETLDELTRLVEERARDPVAERHIHVAWLCIHEDGRRVEDADRDLCRTLSEHMPVLGVITKARSDEGFRAEAQRLLPEAANIVRVRAIAEVLDDGHTLEPMGLEDLIEATIGLLPEGFRGALAAAQRVSLRHKRERARRCVWSASAAAATVGAAPIPLADAAVLVPIQVRMLAQVSKIYGLDVTKAFLTGLTGLLGPAAGRAIVARALKLVPGAGMVLGGVINAAIAAALTAALGETYIAALDRVFARSKEDMPEPAAVEAEFRKQIRKGIRKARRDARRDGSPRRGIGRLWPFRSS